MQEERAAAWGVAGLLAMLMQQQRGEEGRPGLLERTRPAGRRAGEGKATIGCRAPGATSKGNSPHKQGG